MRSIPLACQCVRIAIKDRCMQSRRARRARFAHRGAAGGVAGPVETVEHTQLVGDDDVDSTLGTNVGAAIGRDRAVDDHVATGRQFEVVLIEHAVLKDGGFGTHEAPARPVFDGAEDGIDFLGFDACGEVVIAGNVAGAMPLASRATVRGAGD